MGPFRNPALLVILVVLVAAAGGFSAALNAYGLHLKKEAIYPPDGRPVARIPYETRNWERVGSDHVMSAEIVEELGTENYLSRVYVEKNPADPERRHAVELHLAYYTGTIDTVPHVPERCFVAGGLLVGEGSAELALTLDDAGWREDTDVPEHLLGRVYTARTQNRYSDAPGKRVRLPYDPRSMTLYTTGFQSESGNTFYAGYMFLANGGSVARAEGVRTLAFQLTADYAYYLKVQFSSRTARDREEFARIASDLFDDLLPEIMRCVPDWVEVETGRYPAEGSAG